jgi:hypothetical protein
MKQYMPLEKPAMALTAAEPHEVAILAKPTNHATEVDRRAYWERLWNGRLQQHRR